MKPPYYRLTSRCRNERCETGLFTRERKSITYQSTDGTTRSREVQSCPICRTWSTIMKIEEVKE